MDEKTYLLSESTNLEPQQKHLKKNGWRRYWSFDCLPFIPARYSLVLVSCLGFVNVYALRVNLSVAIVQMVNSTTTTLGNQSGTAEVGGLCTCLEAMLLSCSSAQVFDWSSVQVGKLIFILYHCRILSFFIACQWFVASTTFILYCPNLFVRWLYFK